MTISEPSHRSRLPSRVALVDELLAPWQWDTRGPNLLLTGPPGIGKSHILEELVASLGELVQVVNWRDFADAVSAADHGDRGPADFAGPVAGAGDQDQSSTLSLYCRARSWVIAHGDDHPMLVVIDDLHLVSEVQRRTLAQLARDEHIILLGAATSVRTAGRSLGQLWRDGLMQNRTVPALELTDVMELGRFVLGEVPTSSVAGAILRSSSGVPGQAAAAFRRGSPGEAGAVSGSVDDAPEASGDLPLVTGSQRRILEVLAKIRDFPASVLVQLYGAQDLDLLIEKGLLRIDGRGSTRAVVIANSWLAASVDRAITPERERELYATVEAFQDDERITGGAAADLVLWRLKLGLPVECRRVEFLAEQAAENADYSTVLALLDSIEPADSAEHIESAEPTEPIERPGPGRRGEMRGLKVLALASLGRVDAAMELAFPLLHTDPRETGTLPAREVEALYILAAMSTQLRRSAGEFERLLALAENHHAHLAELTRDPRSISQTTALHEAMWSARWVMDDFRGEFDALMDSVTRASSARRVDRTTRALMVAMTAKTNAICGRPLDGRSRLARAVRIEATARNAFLAERQTDDAALFVKIFSGAWQELLDDVQRQHTEFPRRPGWVRHNLLLGAVLLLSGRPHQALEHLSVALHDSESGGDFPVPHLVVTATACAHAWAGQRDSAKALLRLAETMTVQESYFYRGAGGYFRGLTDVLLGDVAGGVQCWRSWADDAVARGCDGMAMMFLQALARVGSELAVTDLLTVSARSQGPWAEALGLLAQALHTEKITDMRAALRAAVALGDLSLAGFLERLIGVRGNTTGARPVLPFPDDERGAAVHSGEDPRGVSMAAVLTAREREIADLATAGLTNQAIAEEIGLSRRTVEGHMRQVLRKLNITRRTELVHPWNGEGS